MDAKIRCAVEVLRGVSKKVCLANSKRMLGKRNNWRGGRIIDRGWVRVWKPEHPHASQSGYMKEHRLVMEKHLGRYLRADEMIHHINQNRSDNRIENLKIISIGEHSILHNSRRASYFLLQFFCIFENLK